KKHARTSSWQVGRAEMIVALLNRAAHDPSAIGHSRILQPALAKFAEALGFLDTPLLAPLFEGGRDAILYHQLGFDQLLSRARQRNASWPVSADDHRFPTPVQTVVEAEGQRAGRRDQ